jgi:hypothetical protein
MRQTTGNYSQSLGFNNENDSVYILKAQEMLSDLPYIHLTRMQFRLKIQGEAPLVRTALPFDVTFAACLTCQRASRQ